MGFPDRPGDQVAKTKPPATNPPAFTVPPAVLASLLPAEQTRALALSWALAADAQTRKPGDMTPDPATIVAAAKQYATYIGR